MVSSEKVCEPLTNTVENPVSGQETIYIPAYVQVIPTSVDARTFLNSLKRSFTGNSSATFMAWQNY